VGRRAGIWEHTPVAKSNKQRRQGRAKRANTAQQRARRRQESRKQARAGRITQALYDPEAPVEAVAAAIVDMFAPGPTPSGLPALLAERRPAEDLAAIADALDALTTAEGRVPSLTLLTFRAHEAGLAGDYAQARALMDEAFGLADDPDVELTLAGNLVELGRIADALDLMAPRVVDTVNDDVVSMAYEDAWQTAHRRLNGEVPVELCSCGSGQAWTDCCRPREERWLAAFADRSSIYDLRSAVVEFMDRTPYGPAIEERVLDWLRDAGAESRAPDEIEALSRLAYEYAWQIASPDEGGSGAEDDCVLTALADDPATPEPIASAARTWLDHLRYGLWLVADPVPSPGLRVMDILTGHELYVSVPPEQAEGLARWSVLVGAIVPLDGAWRTTGTFVRVSPSEGDLICEATHVAVEEFIDEMRREAGMKVRPRPARRSREIPPHNVSSYFEEEADPLYAGVASRVLGATLPSMLDQLHQSRSAPPELRNSDGEPITMITARIRVDDPATVARALSDHPDFSHQPDQPGRWTWLGATMPEAQHAAMVAQLKAQLRAQGQGDVEIDDDDSSRRWVRGTVVADGDVFKVEVNSAARLDALVEVLAKLGASPSIVDQSRFEPSQDLAWPPALELTGGGPTVAPPGEGWERAWLDERVPALGGRTPRAVAGSPDWPLLEAMLRQFEYGADMAGRPGHDIAWLRAQLKMPPVGIR